MANQSFESSVTDWARATERRLHAVFRASAQALYFEVRRPKGKGGNMPVDTGNLRRSLVASNSSMPRLAKLGSPRVNYPEAISSVTAVIANTPLGGRVYLGFQAAYASIQEWRNGFVRQAAMRWPQIVMEQSRELERRTNSRRRS